MMTNGSLPTYFAGLVQKADPGSAGVTAVNTLNTALTTGQYLMPTEICRWPTRTRQGRNLVSVFSAGPSRFELDANLVKRMRMDEKRTLEFRADVVNILNHPIFSNPDTNINSATFGLISSVAGDGRRFTLGARLNF